MRQIIEFAAFFKKLLILLAVASLSVLPVDSVEATVDSHIGIEQPAAAKTTKKICLSMIVKNESKIIERCLNSIKPVADCISICDTGSTDNTAEIIENFLKTNNIPGKVHHHPWKNFGHNRTLSAKAAQATLRELGFSLPDTYLLLLDADMMLKVADGFKKEDLNADSYMVKQENTSISYFNTRLIRASLPWECVGVTHEYWTSNENKNQGNLTTLFIDDHEDGGCKADKFERDVRLLTQGLKDEPDNVRYMFYLGQSHRCLRQYDDAIKWYKARIEKGGWNEEVYYAKYMIAEMYEEMGFWDQALEWYLEAYQYLPERAEPLQKIASHYRQKSEHNLAYLFAKQGSRIPYPKEHVLFVSYPVYHYQFDEEMAVSAYYTPFKDEGFAAANRITLNRTVPDHVKTNNYMNLLFYVNNLKISKVLPIKIDLPLIREGLEARYAPMNPSILKTPEGYNVICRTVNFKQKGGTSYEAIDPEDKTIRTKNYMLRYDPDFKLLSQREIVEDLPRMRYPTQIKGLEDCRLFESNQYHWMFSTTYDTHPGVVSQSLCQMKNDPNASGQLAVEKLVPLKGINATNNEKNWLPFVKNGILYAIYGYDPLIVFKINRDTGDCESIIDENPKHDFTKFRGSAPPIEFDGGYLIATHEVVFMNDQRTYLHRFVYFDNDFKVAKVSKPFTFFHKGVEYCCGLTTDHKDKNAILTVGFEDSQAFIVFVDLDHVRTLLEPLP